MDDAVFYCCKYIDIETSEFQSGVIANLKSTTRTSSANNGASARCKLNGTEQILF
jgi:hypothetical protein